MFYSAIIEKLLPKSLAPLLQVVGPSFFEVVQWQDLSKNGMLLLQHFGDGKRDERLVMEEQLAQLLRKTNIGVSLISKSSEESSNRWFGIEQTASAKKVMGERVLALYFLQLKNERGLFLDLRPARFVYEQNTLSFKTSTVWIHLSEHFRRALVDLYTGFYVGDNLRFEAGLAGVGLIQEQMSAAQKAEMKTMFLKHFGDGDQTRLKFHTKHFIDSFESIFRFMLTHKLKMSAEFLYLGIYLAGLYLNLEKFDTELNVRAAFESAEIYR